MKVPTDMTDDQKSLRFFYIKSNHFREIVADGAHGGIGPRGGVHMVLFSERQPIPQEEVFPLQEGGEPGRFKLGNEERDKRVQKNGIVREVEVGVRMSLEAAIQLKVWLGERIAELQAADATQGEEGAP